MNSRITFTASLFMAYAMSIKLDIRDDTLPTNSTMLIDGDDESTFGPDDGKNSTMLIDGDDEYDYGPAHGDVDDYDCDPTADEYCGDGYGSEDGDDGYASDDSDAYGDESEDAVVEDDGAEDDGAEDDGAEDDGAEDDGADDEDD